MNAATLAVLATLPGWVVGYVLHELAHYAPLRAAQRDVTLSLWPPAVSFVVRGRVDAVTRVAAVAPALVGVAVLAGLFGFGLWSEWLALGLVVGACTRLFKLSPADRALARGRVKRP